MRRLIPAVVLSVIASAVMVAMPVMAEPAATPHPVAPSTQHLIVSTAALSDALPATTLPATPSGTAPGALRAADQILLQTSEETTSPFRMVGLSWAHDPGLTALSGQIRVRTDGRWSGWQPIANSDLGTDNNTPAQGGSGRRDGVDPLWVDHADGVQLEVTSYTGDAPRDLSLDLINPGMSAADVSVTKSPPVSSASADAAEPTILTRAQWGADESIRQRACPSGPEYTGTPQVAFLHHTVTGNGYAPGDVPAIIRSIYAYHVESEGWCDVGYNFLVDAYGRIWEGRSGGVDKAVLGAHTGGFNTDSFGVSLIGTFTTATPPAVMMTATAALMAWKLGLAYDNPVGKATLTAAPFDGSRYAAGTNVSFNVISGHRDADQTDCPGSGAYALLPSLRQQVLTDMGAGLVAPAAVVTVPRSLSSGGSVQVTSGMIAAGSWQLAVQDGSGDIVRTMSGTGSTISTTWDMTDDGGDPVPAGVYQLTLTSTQNGALARAWATTVSVGGVFGSLESAKGSLAAGAGQVAVAGWAANPADADPASMQVTVDGTVVGTGVATLPRADVTAKYPAYAGATGFTLTVPAKPGYHTVCLLGDNSAFDIPGLANTSLGCLGATVPGAVSTGIAVPVGSLDLVRAGVGSVTVGGWSFDANTVAPILVHVYVDNVFRGVFTANGNRPDVARVYPSEGSDHGYGATVSGLLGGAHTVCVYGINVGGGKTNTQLGCKKYTAVGGNPRGDLNAAVGQPGNGEPGSITVSGWVLDPDTTAGPTVHVYVDGKFAGRTTANLARTDVAVAFPGYGATHGFAVTVPVVSAGAHQVCVYAINVGVGTTNPKFGCATVVVPA